MLNQDQTQMLKDSELTNSEELSQLSSNSNQEEDLLTI